MSNPLRFAVVGTRNWSASFHLPGLAARSNVILVALCGHDRIAAQARAQQFSISHVYTDWREMIEREPLDGIAIGTPNHMHAPIALAAFGAGLHVICDKPLALNSTEARAMLDRAVERDRRHLVMFNYRSMPAARRIQELVQTGYLGRIFHVTALYEHNSYVDPDKPFAWRMSKAESGTGTLGDLGSHIVDLVRWWIGDFAQVSGRLVTFNRERRDATGKLRTVDVDDAAAFMAEMQDGAQALFQVTKLAPGRGNYLRIELYGSEGALVLDADPGRRDNWVGTLLGARRDDKDLVPLEVPSRLTAGFETGDVQRSLVSSFKIMSDPFFAAIQVGGGRVPSDFSDGLAVQHVIDAVAQSAETGQWTPVNRVP